MSNLRQAAQQALEFCEFLWRDVMMNDYSFERLEQNITSLRAALAEPDINAELVEALRQIEPILARMYGAQAADLPPMQIVRAALAKARDAAIRSRT